MKQKKEILDALAELSELDKLLTARILDLSDVKLGTEARHAFILYRKYVSGAIKLLNQELAK